MKLSKSEEQLMEIIWQHDKIFMKDILETYPDPAPAVTTIAILLKRMQDKGFVGYHLGNLRQYYPLVKKEDYFGKHVKSMIKDYFGN
jgi:BlaI family transcriptional regulator, penicillinase repressor